MGRLAALGRVANKSAFSPVMGLCVAHKQIAVLGVEGHFYLGAWFGLKLREASSPASPL